MFVDTAVVQVIAGRGGNGALSFRHEKFIDMGGPDGGDGGRGGDVVFEASSNVNTLADFRMRQELKAEDGGAGSKQLKHGRNGKDIVVKVPVGTLVLRDGVAVADLVVHGQQEVVAKGGDGGFGNAHFKSSTRQAPRVAELGELGDQFEAALELKLLADVGLVGFPNAGKSTLLSVVTKARPEIADYQFTTLSPNLGVTEIDDKSLLIADIPGLIEGASEGKGLGDAFLRHIERTAVILHLIDVYADDPAASYKTIRGELERYSSTVAAVPGVVALTKIEGLDDDVVAMQRDALRAVVPATTKVYAVSAQAHKGMTELLRELSKLVTETRTAKQEAVQEEYDAIPVIQLSDTEVQASWTVEKDGDGYVVTGDKIEKFARRTDATNVHALNRLRDIMRKMGITHELVRQRAKSTSQIRIGSCTFTLTEQ
jgi:GTP-binding protein